MKFLMIGLGSIGQRHLRNIKRVYGEEAEILAYRVRGLKRTFSDTMQIRENVSLEEEYNIKTFTSLSEALLEKPDFAFVTNPTSLHIETAVACLEAGCHVFLEKPVSDTMEGMDKLLAVANSRQGQKVFVGYQNRLHPGIARVKEALEKEELGQILSVRSVVGERLTTMHTYEDYKETYMARKDMGGGVVTNQMVHEMDYLYYLFGAPKRVYAVGGTLGNLGIDVEDVCDAVFTMACQGRDIPVSVHADFYQSPPSRFIQVVGTGGQMKADLIGNTFTKTIQDVTTEEAFEGFNRNDMFIAELKAFVDCTGVGTAEGGGARESGIPLISLTDGVMGMEMMNAVKESMKNGGMIYEFASGTI